MGLAPLRDLPLAVRAGLTGAVLSLLVGVAASLAQLEQHHANRDGEPGVSLDDLRGAYHGIAAPAPLARALERGHPPEAPAEDRDALLAWLRGDRIGDRYDDPDLGARAPAEILSRRCVTCHSRKATVGGDIGQKIPLDYWDDVDKLSHARDIAVVPSAILVTSTHTHALSLGVVTLAVIALVLATRWGAGVKGGVALGSGVALFVDLASWWLARGSAGFVLLIVGGGAVWFACITAGCVAVIGDLWLPRRGPRLPEGPIRTPVT